MGKKSRKKVGKKEHQERMKARAEKREEQLIQAEEEDEADQDKLPIYGGKPREFIDGDYVRYYERKNASVRRGVISDFFKDGKKDAVLRSSHRLINQTNLLQRTLKLALTK